MPLEDFIINVYCIIDDMMLKLTKGCRLRQRGFKPKLSDTEVITIDIVGEFLGKDTDKGIWRYFKTHWHNWFPGLGSRSTMQNTLLIYGGLNNSCKTRCQKAWVPLVIHFIWLMVFQYLYVILNVLIVVVS